MKKAAGFTLIELLVAISVLAIVAVLGWRGLDSIVRARVALTSELKSTRGLQLAFAQMQSDAAHLAPDALLENRMSLDARPGRLTLIRTVNIDNQPTLVQVVSYRVRDGVLSRRESVATRDLRQLDVAWAAALADSDTSQPVTLQDEVDEMRIRSWDSQSAAWRAEAVATPPPTVIPAVPGAPGTPATAQSQTGLEVTLRLRDRSTNLVKIFLLGAI
ncbi:MAG TPA: prepilin-type N-terminal cleavage/methylation domain-containing protein [Noviherbaspirillum sp.]|jgi:general secretion pathway protein J|uniref:PulJ/GspJ family protein n=1 Tax=Noviherbaspirillum sp. TaxID=1926288 RepID=UPI002DDDA980|nr:prepilin-type N-terminal cleavage/methylation domain-containing protein [Noviherbaspirillum sp.]HEV2611154.1 prepilin-type N-terminal cleavage/methylation domain-containing protein [Noviherbaspirillum sp.]